MSVGLFIDKNHPPDEADVAAAIGPMLPLWQVLIQFIRDNYAVQENFKFLYGKNYGWALRFRVRGKLLTALYPTRNGFTVQVILAPAAIEEAQRMAMGNPVQQAIARATPYPEGRWLFVPVESDADIADIQRVLALRATAHSLKKESAL